MGIGDLKLGKRVMYRRERWWRVQIINPDTGAYVDGKNHPVEEEDLTHIGNDPTRLGPKKEWDKFRMVGNVNKCNLKPPKAGSKQSYRFVDDRYVPGYGELYEHCLDTKGKKKKCSFWIYKCGYCSFEKNKLQSTEQAVSENEEFSLPSSRRPGRPSSRRPGRPSSRRPGRPSSPPARRPSDASAATLSEFSDADTPQGATRKKTR